MKVKVKATGKIIDVRIHGMNANGKCHRGHSTH